MYYETFLEWATVLALNIVYIKYVIRAQRFLSILVDEGLQKLPRC